MDAQQFLAEFGHIANAPEGVARLRELVYQFAVTGRLTAQREEAEESWPLRRIGSESDEDGTFPAADAVTRSPGVFGPAYPQPTTEKSFSQIQTPLPQEFC